MENRLIILLIALVLLVGCTASENVSEQSKTAETSEEAFKETSDETSEEASAEISAETSDETSITDETDDPSESISEEERDDSDESCEKDESKAPVTEPNDSDLVLISDYIPDIKTDIRYATENNFTGKVIYESDKAYLRYGTVKKLMQVQDELKKMGYQLLIWDAFRPTEAQWKLWEICPDASYVSNPNNGYSSHSRGNTVDITILRSDGSGVEMPSGFDEFTKLADRDYSDVSEEAAQNSKMLEDIMKKHGFSGYINEWWHYSDTVRYDVVK